MCLLLLINDQVLRHVENNLNIVDQEVKDILIPLEYFILLDRIQEYVLGDFPPETGRYHLKEIIKLILAIQVHLGANHEFADLVLEQGGQAHVEHACVGQVDLALDPVLPSVHRLEHYGRSTEHVGQDDSAHDIGQGHESYMGPGLGLDVLTH